MSHILHITDLHLLEDERGRLQNVDTTATLRAVLAAATAERKPAVLLATGDIAHDPTTATYRRCLSIFQAFHSGPTICLPGNHDLLPPMLEAGMPMAPVQLGRWRVIPWDTHGDDCPGAVWDEARWRALRAAIHGTDGYALVATHHPLIDVGSAWLDKDRLDNAEDVMNRLAQMPAARAVAFGHAHQVVDSRHRGLRLLGTPATCFQFQPNSNRFGLDGTGPGYRWLHLHDDGGFDTDVRYLETA